jgi:hypothetical protein
MSAAVASNQASAQTIYHVDREHGSMRFIVLVIFILSWIIVGMLVSAIIRNEGLSLLAIIIGFAAAYVITAVAERQLKRRWISGRKVEVSTDAVRLYKRGQLESEMRADRAVEPLYWRFQIKKRARIPKGWWMYACGLESDSDYLVAYTFLSPAQAEQYGGNEQFKLLQTKKDQQSAENVSLRLAGEERRLRAAEEFRWVSGAEMNSDDFMRYLEQLNTQFPEWQPLA